MIWYDSIYYFIVWNICNMILKLKFLVNWIIYIDNDEQGLDGISWLSVPGTEKAFYSVKLPNATYSIIYIIFK